MARNCQIFAVAVVCLGGMLNTGCDECASGETRCEGDAVFTCNSDEEGLFGKNRWQAEQQCAVACRYLGGGARCVTSTQPAAECTGVSGDLCLDGVPSTCLDGYLFQRTQCGSRVCVAPHGCDAMCAASATPEPRCAARSFCDGNRVATCKCGFVTGEQDCGTQVCHEAAGEAACTVSASLDPRCGSPNQPSSAYCGDGVAFACWYGYVIFTYDCAVEPCVCRGFSCAVPPEQASRCPSATPVQI